MENPIDSHEENFPRSLVGRITLERRKRLAEWDGHVAPGTILPVKLDYIDDLYGKELLADFSEALAEHGAIGLRRRYRWLGYDHDVSFTGVDPAEWILRDPPHDPDDKEV